MKENELFNPDDCGCSRNYNHKNDPFFGEKVGHEIHRMLGFLRFSPDENGVFAARCAPDYYILPALEPYFTERFGDTPWEIIDEKRGLCLSRKTGAPGEKAVIKKIGADASQDNANRSAVPADEWEDIWKHYHKIINNESRDNPALQRQFMPKRYRKYLPEANEQ